jgi:molybdopterin converting factor small subunit
MNYMRVTALLGGNLRKEAKEGPQERTVELASTARVSDLIDVLGLAQPRVGQIFVNGKGSTDDASLKDGDRVGLFPPELRFNIFVSLYFRKENVESRKSDREE